MKRKTRPIRYKKERALLSDVLPYELPFIFSNHHFYKFVLDTGLECRFGKFFWRKDDGALDTTMRLLLGVRKEASIEAIERPWFGKQIEENSFHETGDHFDETIPFSFRIRHKDTEFRELAVCHPRQQLQIVEFYHRFKETILYYCSLSPFSIRRPVRIARSVYHKDRAHYTNLSTDPFGVEEFNKEYENLRSFFVYANYNHISAFFEDYRFHRSELKYDKMMSLDISKCFESIYTHSLPWALFGKETAKVSRSKPNATFGGRFDTLMQHLNYAETNGIVIGPEFSRIFAELILQSVDRALYLKLRAQPFGYYHRRDYEIFRYVDDYFVFYNDDKVRDAILQELQMQLRGYKLQLNSGKAVPYEKPIITPITIAKRRINTLLADVLAYNAERSRVGGSGGDSAAEMRFRKTGHIEINRGSLITQFKTVIKESGVAPKDILNYSLSVIGALSADLLRNYRARVRSGVQEAFPHAASLDICYFTFFVYSMYPRANITIKLCRVLNVFTSFLKGKDVHADVRHSVFKLIFDNVGLILRKNKTSEHTQQETLFLLILLSELGKDYWLDIETLCSHFNFEARRGTGHFKSKFHLNYVSIVVLLFYMKRKRRYERLRMSVQQAIRHKFKIKKSILRKDTELTLLLLDTLTCPYVDHNVKSDLLKIYGVTDDALQRAVISKRRYWFTKWTAFDYGKELDAKRSLEVY
jgi:hypothetical protein